MVSKTLTYPISYMTMPPLYGFLYNNVMPWYNRFNQILVEYVNKTINQNTQIILMTISFNSFLVLEDYSQKIPYYVKYVLHEAGIILPHNSVILRIPETG